MASTNVRALEVIVIADEFSDRISRQIRSVHHIAILREIDTKLLYAHHMYTSKKSLILFNPLIYKLISYAIPQ